MAGGLRSQRALGSRTSRDDGSGARTELLGHRPRGQGEVMGFLVREWSGVTGAWARKCLRDWHHASGALF